uniref:Uncharacterized protein n=1 Tax=Magnetococcus massalia (strain MO-1) TaxID=451514 RepID=A0A1S7LK91_MAGMO|nr:protein of unknown function [Candidatus Magnetococcus massalia]
MRVNISNPFFHKRPGDEGAVYSPLRNAPYSDMAAVLEKSSAEYEGKHIESACFCGFVGVQGSGPLAGVGRAHGFHQ